MKREHVLEKSVDNHQSTEFCSVCGAEGKELTTDCPGFVVETGYRNKVALGELDFINGTWKRIKRPIDTRKGNV